ncbi:MAG: hypothetical protein PWP27_593 [Clostridiales bacterium]|jgi:hypothetical protein|nr:hypothetical protein [Clostridiales bacterium]MDK2932783.1 hypothetical protein [Clostridiales bacterium]
MKNLSCNPETISGSHTKPNKLSLCKPNLLDWRWKWVTTKSD